MNPTRGQRRLQNLIRPNKNRLNGFLRVGPRCGPLVWLVAEIFFSLFWVRAKGDWPFVPQSAAKRAWRSLIPPSKSGLDLFRRGGDFCWTLKLPPGAPLGRGRATTPTIRPNKTKPRVAAVRACGKWQFQKSNTPLFYGPDRAEKVTSSGTTGISAQMQNPFVFRSGSGKSGDSKI